MIEKLRRRFGRARLPEAVVLPLEFWQDPVNEVLLLYSDLRCSIYFPCWTDSREPADFLGYLEFENASAVRSARREHPPYRVPDHDHHSYILEIPHSAWVYTPEARHFVVMGHDVYHEIVAASFTATTIPNDQVTDETLRTLIATAPGGG